MAGRAATVPEPDGDPFEALGDPNRREILRQLETGSGEPARALPVARVYTGLGDREQAFLWLQKAVDQRDVALFLIADPVYDGLRGDTRFHALLERASLTPGSSSEVSIP